MKVRRTFLIGRAAAFALLLATAGATSLSVASGAQDARQAKMVSDAKPAGFAQATSTAAIANGVGF